MVYPPFGQMQWRQRGHPSCGAVVLGGRVNQSERCCFQTCKTMQGGVESLARRVLGEQKKGQQEYAVDLCGRAAPPFWGAFSIASVDLWAPVDDAVVLDRRRVCLAVAMMMW